MGEKTEAKPFVPPEKSYLGDSVYIEFNGNCAVITTNNGYPDDPRNKIAIEPEVWDAMKRWMQRFEQAAKAWREAQP